MQVILGVVVGVVVAGQVAAGRGRHPCSIQVSSSAAGTARSSWALAVAEQLRRLGAAGCPRPPYRLQLLLTASDHPADVAGALLTAHPGEDELVCVNGFGVVGPQPQAQAEDQPDWRVDLGGGCCTAGWATHELERQRFPLGMDQPTTSANGTLLAALQSHGSTYFHALWEVLPRTLHALETSRLQRLEEQRRAVVVVTASPFVRDGLALSAGHRAVPTHLLGADTVACGRRVLIPPQASGFAAGERLHFLRSLQQQRGSALDGGGPSPSQMRTLLVVQRDQHGPHRLRRLPIP